ncbi:phage holin family protein [Vacuolonema iberomarrocanum]|uniref:phage holin family protein n=1 Tax=Vacuolonema iberomarrocanum TaxID=3454632 RepID=UPI001A0E3F93|nr:phage holin family protein [filamentous cyanobacterium LEGE 07170]
MLGYLLTTLITALSLLVTDILLPGVSLANFPAAIVAGVAIGLVNSFVKPVLSILSLPVTFLTLGLFSLVVNGICFSLAAFFVPGFAVHGLVAFIVGPIILSLASTLLNRYFVAKQIPGSSALPTDKPVGTNS